MIETHQRTLVRAITYRLLALILTAFWTGLGTAVLIHVLLTLIHYAHERVWLRIRWGMTSTKVRDNDGHPGHSMYMTGSRADSRNTTGH